MSGERSRVRTNMGRNPEGVSRVKSNVGERLGRDAVDATVDRSRVKSNIGSRLREASSPETDQAPESPILEFAVSDALEGGKIDENWVEDLVSSILEADCKGVSWTRDGEQEVMLGIVEDIEHSDSDESTHVDTAVIRKKNGTAALFLSTDNLSKFFTKLVGDHRITGTIEVPNRDTDA